MRSPDTVRAEVAWKFSCGHDYTRLYCKHDGNEMARAGAREALKPGTEDESLALLHRMPRLRFAFDAGLDNDAVVVIIGTIIDNHQAERRRALEEQDDAT